jgi:hypothetical protein
MARQLESKQHAAKHAPHEHAQGGTRLGVKISLDT